MQVDLEQKTRSGSSPQKRASTLQAPEALFDRNSKVTVWHWKPLQGVPYQYTVLLFHRRRRSWPLQRNFTLCIVSASVVLFLSSQQLRNHVSDSARMARGSRAGMFGHLSSQVVPIFALVLLELLPQSQKLRHLSKCTDVSGKISCIRFFYNW